MEQKPVMGRPPHVPTDEQRRLVEELVGLGMTKHAIGRVVGICSRTLELHYRHELDNGEAVAISAVARNLFRMATGDGKEAFQAASFFLKCRANWRTGDDTTKGYVSKRDLRELEARQGEQRTDWDSLLANPPN
jgi:hypothetical protein